MNIYILKNTQKEFREYSGSFYEFTGAENKIKWPRDTGAFLGEAGAYNIFNRVFPGKVHSIDSLEGEYKGDDIILINFESNPPQEKIDGLLYLLRRNITIIATGNLKYYEKFLDVHDIKDQRMDDPYAGLGYQPVLSESNIEFLAPNKWSISSGLIASEETTFASPILKIHGEIQSPTKCLKTKIENSYLLLMKNRFVYLNGRPFNVFQAFLQGQENIYTWMNWHDRQHWLDEYADRLLSLLSKNTHLSFESSSIPSLSVILRHDVDFSRDTSYLDLEQRHDVKGSYSLLMDNNLSYWLKILKNSPHEVTFHYSTGGSFYLTKLMKQLNLPSTIMEIYYKKLIRRNGLSKQIARAKKKGINTDVITRHFNRLYYPEYIDALFYAEKKHPTLSVVSSYFRTMVLRWDDLFTSSPNNSLGEWPDSQFPYWFPFKVAHAGQNGVLSRCFETTSIMESEPEYVQRVLAWRGKCINTFTYVLNYHPAHSKGPLINKNGCLGYLEDIIVFLKKSNHPIITFKDLSTKLKTASE